jgi:hypothetical protein
VTTRHGGVSTGPYSTLNLGLHVGDNPADVLVNRRRVAAATGADLGDFVFCSQAHGRRVIRESGVPDSHIAGSGLSTASRAAARPGMTGPGMTSPGPELFFSDRAARPCGRFAAVARLRPREDT